MGWGLLRHGILLGILSTNFYDNVLTFSERGIMNNLEKLENTLEAVKPGGFENFVSGLADKAYELAIQKPYGQIYLVYKAEGEPDVDVKHEDDAIEGYSISLSLKRSMTRDQMRSKIHSAAKKLPLYASDEDKTVQAHHAFQTKVVDYVQELADKAGASLEFENANYDGDLMYLTFSPTDLVTMSSGYDADALVDDVKKFIKNKYHVMIDVDTDDEEFVLQFSGLKG